MKKSSRSLLLLLPLLACGGGSDIEPKSGTWTYLGSQIVDNTCGDTVPVDPDGDFTINVTGDGKFTVVVAESEEEFTCTHDGATFSCPERLFYTMDYGGDTKVSLRVSIAGDLDSETTVSGKQTAIVNCEGSGCAIAMQAANIEMVPCSYSHTFSAEAAAG